MAKRNNPGCQCCTGTLVVSVTGCNSLPLPGATVTAVQGGNTVTGTTGGAGTATLTLASGSWTITVSKARFVTSSSGTATVVAGASRSYPTSFPFTVAMASDTGWYCTKGIPDPLPPTLYVNDPVYGRTALAVGASVGGFYNWSACLVVAGAANYNSSCVLGGGPYDTAITYDFLGASSNNLHVGAPGCTIAGGFALAQGTCASGFGCQVLAGDSGAGTVPYAGQFVYPNAAGSQGAAMYGVGSRTLTVTET